MWMSAGRDENFRTREQTLTSSRRIAGAVTYYTVNESNPPLTMQMDPTTLQLIQVLERTVSSGECRSRTVVATLRGPAGCFLPLKASSRDFSNESAMLTRCWCNDDGGCEAATRAMASPIWSTREKYRRNRVRVIVLGSSEARRNVFGSDGRRLSRSRNFSTDTAAVVVSWTGP